MSRQSGITTDGLVEQTFLHFVVGTSAQDTESTWWDADRGNLSVGPRGDFAASTVVAGLLGEVGDEGAELELDERLLVDQVGYAGMAFHPITAPTLVFAAKAEDYEVFLEDADLAHEDGMFAERLIAPMVVLAEPGALVGENWTPHTLGNGFTVRGDTILRGRAGGRTGSRDHGLDSGWLRSIGSVDDSCGQGLSDAVIDALEARPWLPRYRRVLQVLRGLSAADRERGVRVSGFGFRLNTTLAPFDDDAERPIVLAVGDETFVVDAGSRRRFRIGRDVARTVESLAAAPHLGPEEAVARGLGVRANVAAQTLQVVTEALLPAGLDLHPGLGPSGGQG